MLPLKGSCLSLGGQVRNSSVDWVMPWPWVRSVMDPHLLSDGDS